MNKQQKDVFTPEEQMLTSFCENTVKYENSFIACLDISEDLFEMAERSHLCNAHEEATILEFENGMNNALYLSIRICKQMSTDRNKPVDPRFVRQWLEYIAGLPHTCGITLKEVDKTMEHFKSLQDQPAESLLNLVTRGFSRWLKKKRLTSYVTSATSDEEWAPDAVEAAVARASASVSSRTDKAQLAACDLFVDLENQAPRLKTSIPRLNDSLGGGYGLGEAVCWISATGGGKTVAALQIAMEMLMSNGPDVRGLYITTEQPPEQLFPRLVSAQLSIPFDENITDGVDLRRLDSKQRQNAADLVKTMGNRLLFERWQDMGNATTFKQDMEAKIQKFLREYGRLDFLVFDWLGAALVGKTEKNPDQLRLIYHFAALALCDLAEQYGFSCHYFAQANPVQADKQKRVKAIHCAECKTIDQKSHVTIGISALKQKGDDSEDGEDVYETRQYWFYDKNRKARGKLLFVDREMHYQRFSFPKTNKMPPPKRKIR